jgi:diadenylate cyclase
MRILGWVLELLIVSAGIHMFLRFVRTTRGNRLIRGLFVTVLGGFVGLWGLSTFLGLEELQHLLQGATGFVIVALAIVFQSELRRAIAQLGERLFDGRLSETAGDDTVSKLARAARSKPQRPVGALNAFERETSLQTFLETGTEIDSDVRVRLVESLFHPGSALHDGAVIVRKDRIAAAGCFFPLTEEGDIDASLGTRHRAAMGITEETDAVVLVVSEETGSISLAREGNIQRYIPPDRLEEELRLVLERKGPQRTGRERRFLPKTLASLRRELGWLAGSTLLAAGILFVAHRDIRLSYDYTVRVTGISPSGRRPPRDGEILVVLPQEEMRLAAPRQDARFKIVTEGARSQLDEIGGTVRGVLEIGPADWNGGPLELAKVKWENKVLGVSYSWSDDPPPELQVERYDAREITLRPEMLVIDDERLDPRYRVERGGIRFEPDARVLVRGPKQKVAAIGVEAPLLIEPITLGERDRSDRRLRIRLDERAAREGFALDDPPEVVIPILPVRWEVDNVEKEIVLVSLDESRRMEVERWRLPVHAQTARFTIETSGLIPINADPGSPALLERFNTIRRFVEENLKVYVDVSELPPKGEGRSVPVRWTWRKEWRESLESLGLDRGTLGDREELNVRLESERVVLLEESTTASDESSGE